MCQHLSVSHGTHMSTQECKATIRDGAYIRDLKTATPPWRSKTSKFSISWSSHARIAQTFKRKDEKQKLNNITSTSRISVAYRAPCWDDLCNFEPKPWAFILVVQLQFSTEPYFIFRVHGALLVWNSPLMYHILSSQPVCHFATRTYHGQILK